MFFIFISESDHRTLEEDRESPTLFASENKDDVEKKDHSANATKEDECSKSSKVMENGENTSNISNGGGHKRKREKKTVTKQYQDEEGFLGKSYESFRFVKSYCVF